MEYLEASLSVVKSCLWIEKNVDVALGKLLQRAWSDDDDVAFAAARDRALEVGYQVGVKLAETMQRSDLRPRRSTNL